MERVAIALASIAVLLATHFAWTYLTSPVRTLPGPFLAKFSGLWRLFMVYRRSAEKEQYALHKRLGPVVALGPDMVTISDPKMIGTIYSRKDILIKSKFYSVDDFMVNGRRIEHAFTTQDENMNSKGMKPIHRLFALNNIVKYEPLVNQTIEVFFKRLSTSFCFTGRTCDLDRWVLYFAWDVVSDATFSKRMGFLEEGRDIDNMVKDNAALNNYFSLFGQMPVLDNFLHKNPIIPFYKLSFFGSDGAVLFALKSIDERRRGVDGHVQAAESDFLDDFLEVQRLNSATVADDVVLNYVLMNVMAGADTVAAALRSVMYYLLSHPDKLFKLQAELDAHDFPVPLSWADAQGLPYLDGCIREGMRLGPSVPFPFERLVGPSGLVLPGGIFLPPGVIVGMNPYVVNRDTGVFGKDAEEFRPERWLRMDGETQEAFTARFALMRDTELTFGEGKRMCPGRFLALFEIYKLVGSLCKTFDFELAPGGRPWKTHNAWFLTQEGLDVVIKKRSTRVV